MKRNLYLDIQDKTTALTNFLEAFDIKPQKEIIQTTESLHRITYEPTYALYSSPSYNSSAMDGIAVISSHTIHASETNPVYLKPEQDYIEIDTGDMICRPYDAVIMAEDLIEEDDGYKIIAPTHPFSHVRSIGEDIVSQEMVLPSHHIIRSIDVAVLLSSGIRKIAVMKKPTVAIIPTGDEMIDYNQDLEDGKIIETNSYMFENLIHEHHGIAHRFPITKDKRSLIKETLLEASNHYDIVIINAGSSAGRDDYTAQAIQELGHIYTHGVSIKPGKPVILGEINHKPVIGLPGYPVSAYMTFMEFVVPLLQKYTHITSQPLPTVKAKLTKTLMSSLKYEEYVRVKLGVVDGQLIATPLTRGAGATMSLVRSDGFCVIPQNSEGILAHEEVDVKLIKDLKDIEKTLVLIGSHDLILDVMNDFMFEHQMDMSLSSTHVGSLSGLIALKKKETHLASTHLLDEKNGTYNVTITKDMFKDENMVIIKGVRRRQGLIVKKGNPLDIQSIQDLTRVRYINRQNGAGTRVLLDYQLKKYAISSQDIQGYDHIATTHMAVAIAVQKDNADTGLGIYSAAKALNLDFIDISYEEYDFVTYKAYLQLPCIQEFIHLLQSQEFLDQLDSLGGYTYEHIGEIIEL